MVKKIIALASLILIEMISGMIIGSLPDPVSPETMRQLSSDPRFNLTYGTSESWLSLAEKYNDSFHFWRSFGQLLFLIGLPALTIGVFITRIL